MAEEASSIPMDSGSFIDIIPIILNYLDLKSLIQLSKTCRFWRQKVYTNAKLWSKEMIELPFVGLMGCDHYSPIDCKCFTEVKLWSTILPPSDPNALEKVLAKIASSQESIQRFTLVEKVHWKNYIHTDESLRLTALLFPSIKQISFEGNLLTDIGVECIAKSCSKLKHIEFYKCENLNIPKVLKFFNSEEHQINLERIFIYIDKFTRDNRFSIEDSLPFMALCQRCGLYFNQFNNEKEMLCLHHPGYNTPNYPSTFGCQYTYHTKFAESLEFVLYQYHDLQDGLPEFMFEKFNYELFPFRFIWRRRLAKCYEKWDTIQKQEETP